MSRFLIADPFHINKKNFASLYQYFEASGAKVIQHTDRSDWINLSETYVEKSEELREDFHEIESLATDSLHTLRFSGVNVFDTARAELMAVVITDPSWNERPFPITRSALFETLNSSFREPLLWYMAAALNWLKYWASYLGKTPNPDFVLVFSGSPVYAKALLGILKNRAPRTFVLETFFTGNDYYVEEKYEHLSNNSNLAQLAYYRSLQIPTSDEDKDRERNKALNKVFAMRNKNVSQPEPSDLRLFDNNNPSIVIVGQVLNDFSLLETNEVGIYSLEVYVKLIEDLLARTNFNVIFKAHPWERKKKGLTAAVTRKRIEQRFVSGSPTSGNFATAPSGRFAVVEDVNLKSLYKHARVIVGINSQALLEAAMEGYRPVQLGSAFFGGKGFTSDYQIEEIDQFVSDVALDSFPNYLDLDGYRSFELFLTKSLQYSLVAVTPSGKSRLKMIFEARMPIKINLKPSAAAAPGGATPAVARSPALDKGTTRELGATSGFSKKLQKFRRSPRRFFLESKSSVIRPLHVLFRQ